jgi:hypothetical protein
MPFSRRPMFVAPQSFQHPLFARRGKAAELLPSLMPEDKPSLAMPFLPRTGSGYKYFKYRSPRRGAVAALLLVLLGVFLAAMALAIDSSNLWNARAEMQSSVDAAALAGSLGLADDAVLSVKPGLMRGVVAHARQQAMQYANSNHVLAQPLLLEPNDENDPDGDIVVGFLEHARAGFQPAAPSNLDNPLLNAVHITGRRTKTRGNPARLFLGRLFQFGTCDVLADATAFLDRDVVGFRPVGRQAIPMVPIALLSDPQALKEHSWEAQVVKPATMPEAGGKDEYVFDPVRKKFRHVPTEVPQGDGIFEMEVKLPLQGATEDREGDDEEEEPNGVLLHLGNGDWTRLCRQIASGVSGEDLADWDGQFVLGWDNLLFVPSVYSVPDRQSAQFMQLLNALKTLETTGEPRVWPLFGQLQPTGREMQATCVVRGFVAARVVLVELVSGPEPHVRLVLQPCQLVTTSALTDHARAAKSNGSLVNPYIARVRLAE